MQEPVRDRSREALPVALTITGLPPSALVLRMVTEVAVAEDEAVCIVPGTRETPRASRAGLLVPDTAASGERGGEEGEGCAGGVAVGETSSAGPVADGTGTATGAGEGDNSGVTGGDGAASGEGEGGTSGAVVGAGAGVPETTVGTGGEVGAGEGVTVWPETRRGKATSLKVIKTPAMTEAVFFMRGKCVHHPREHGCPRGYVQNRMRNLKVL